MRLIFICEIRFTNDERQQRHIGGRVERRLTHNVRYWETVSMTALPPACADR